MYTSSTVSMHSCSCRNCSSKRLLLLCIMDPSALGVQRKRSLSIIAGRENKHLTPGGQHLEFSCAVEGALSCTFQHGISGFVGFT